MKTKIDLMSLAAGTVLGAAVVLSIGAATRQPAIPEIANIRFLVIDITRHGEPVNGQQRAVLRLARFYGKIDQESLDFRLKHETQDYTLVTSLDPGSTIRTNDIIGFQASEHTKLAPGSSVITHLPPSKR
jgi:hypothetical protein